VAVAALPGGFLIGLLLSVFSSRYAGYGPPPAICCLLPQQIIQARFRKGNEVEDSSNATE